MKFVLLLFDLFNSFEVPFLLKEDHPRIVFVVRAFGSLTLMYAILMCCFAADEFVKNKKKEEELKEEEIRLQEEQEQLAREGNEQVDQINNIPEAVNSYDYGTSAHLDGLIILLILSFVITMLVWYFRKK